MNKEFYLKHKDIEWKMPLMTNDGSIHETDGQAVTGWMLNEMQQGRIGWIQFNLMTIKPPTYTPMPWTHQSRVETETLWANHKELFKETTKGVYEYKVKDKEGWKPWEDFPAPQMSAYWVGDDFPCTRLSTGRYERTEPNSSTEVYDLNINENPDIANMATYQFPLLMPLITPGNKCHAIIEDFGTLKLHEGYTYLLNPWRKMMLVNTSENESAVQFYAQVLLGNEAVPFSDVITRSYFQAIGHMHK